MARIDPLVVRDYLVGLQGRITDTVESLDGQAKFLRDEWRKAPGEPLQGDGITKIMEGGAVFERAGAAPCFHVKSGSSARLASAECYLINSYRGRCRSLS